MVSFWVEATRQTLALPASNLVLEADPPYYWIATVPFRHRGPSRRASYHLDLPFLIQCQSQPLAESCASYSKGRRKLSFWHSHYCPSCSAVTRRISTAPVAPIDGVLLAICCIWNQRDWLDPSLSGTMWALESILNQRMTCCLCDPTTKKSVKLTRRRPLGLFSCSSYYFERKVKFEEVLSIWK